ncbi:MAG: hypothetical protein A3J66_02785 [Candidatus Magasanikbacteria bacterium RIFCSPHIGHO2_02_FULL_47_14]|uniref:Metallo-beta-lactamase domain-containing protein n=1 Tax=Candidatus Magasanikbacteria bacterium RIFCSPHIGHO2_02_FULL_47_14 TaxID=1798680 RepID=A0A1F6M8G2_9BACT|nr:MAG: hypothetical protein A3J66_02785 [Candidatus Magasanikbacteria bacterium RIFCSPHIGHO2_02_FULL_47_14]
MKKQRNIFLVCIVIFVIAALIGYCTYTVIKKRNASGEKELIISFLDIGQGDATFITFPNGQQMLVDCAIDARILEALGRVMPFRDFSIDYLVVTHPDLDHYGGCVDVLKRFDVAQTLYNGYQKETIDYFDVFQQVIQEEGIYHEVSQEEVLEIASTSVRFLYPTHSVRKDPRIPGNSTDTGSNNTSVVMKLTYGDEDVLLTGDTEAPLEEYLVSTYDNDLDAEVLKVGHHGSGGSSSQEFLQKVSPEHAVISVGADNRYGHPSGRVLKRLQRLHASVWRTDQMGDIIAHITPSTVYVETREQK